MLEPHIGCTEVRFLQEGSKARLGDVRDRPSAADAAPLAALKCRGCKVPLGDRRDMLAAADAFLMLPTIKEEAQGAKGGTESLLDASPAELGSR